MVKKKGFWQKLGLGFELYEDDLLRISLDDLELELTEEQAADVRDVLNKIRPQKDKSISVIVPTMTTERGTVYGPPFRKNRGLVDADDNS